MATGDRERVDRALTLLSEALAPFVDQHCRARYGDNWVEKFAQAKSYEFGKTVTVNLDDLQFQLKTMIDEWRNVFSKTLGHAERNLVGELYDTRNRWAHQGSFSIDQAYRAADSALLLAQAVSAGEQALELDKMKHELLRIKFDEERKRRPQKDAEGGIQVSAPGGLAPWREVVTPHPDVASGRYQQAEFAADLYQVAHDLGEDEYRDPVEFFRRTFLTQGLRELLVDTSRRLRGEGGNPIVQLQTNFGGGKTHSMIALYHLASGVEPEKLVGVDEMLQDAGVEAPPAATAAVVVGHMLNPNTPHTKPDGTEVRTLWGELAWQLGGRAAFDLVAEADRTGTSPGDLLVDVIRTAAPCLILIDEWIAHVRQLYGVNDLPAGSFDAHFSFAQALCDAVKIVPNALLVVSIPSSDVEVGGDGGKAALERLTNVIGRQDSPWRPASAEEGFEIVRRRLFKDVSADSARERDSVVRAFGDLYRAQPAEFPSPTREGRYEDRLLAAYPIHPEVFDRLYEDWSTLDKFQRTRGVLRLMAAVIHELWERQDSGLLITPASVPIDAPAVKSELTRYLEDGWDPVIAADVDGPSSLPLQIDRENPNLGRYSAARRVARTIYLGSAAVKEAANRGLDERSVKLGCVQPGESAAVFGDALRKMTDRATYLYAANERVWYSLQPSVTRMAADRAARVPLDEVDEEIRRRLMAQRERGEFAAVHVSPESGREVEDRAAARLVILGPDHPHATRSEVSLALDVAKEMLEERQGGPRTYRNMLVFLAPDQARLEELRDAVRQWTAWDTIVGEAEELNLDAQQRRQAETKQRQSTETVNQRIGETFQWLVVPSQKEPGDPEVTWEVLRVTGQDLLAVRASRKLQSDEHLITAYSGTRVRMDLDKVPLWRGDHVGVRQLWDDYARYLYLPRLRDEQVMLKAIADGVASTTWNPETFGYADAYNDETGEYRGVKAGEQANVVMSSASVVIKPEAVTIAPEIVEVTNGGGPQEQIPEGVTRFHAVVDLDRDKVSKQLLDVLQHVIEHLETAGAKVSLTLEIEADSKEPFDDATQRTVTENAHTLKFRIHGFER